MAGVLEVIGFIAELARLTEGWALLFPLVLTF
jgi:hypothetical protein